MSIQSHSHSRNRPLRKKWPVVFVKRPHRLLRRKTLLALAGVILLACAISRPLSFIFVLCGDKFVALVIAAFLIVAAIRVLVPVFFRTIFFRTRGRAWHTRLTAPLFLFVSLVGVNLVVLAADRLAQEVLGTGLFLSSAAAVYVLIGLELMWIAVLR